MRRAHFTTSAAPTSTFLGSHPRKAQVPPNGRLSTIATLHSAARHREAAVEAADPVPMTTTSNLCSMSRFFSRGAAKECSHGRQPVDGIVSKSSPVGTQDSSNPLGLGSRVTVYPGLAPGATFLRRF